MAAGKDYNFTFTWGAGVRPAFGGSNTAKHNTSLNSKNNKSVSNANLKGLASLGMAIRVTQQFNETLGSYTENRLRQRKIQVGMQFGKYAIGMMLDPVLGTAYAVTDLGYRTLSFGIQMQKKNRKADYYKRLSGNNTNSGSRYRGSYS